MNNKEEQAKQLHAQGVVMIRAKKIPEGRVLLQKAIEVYPQFALSYFLMGTTYFDEQNYEEAVKWFRKAHKLMPK